MNFHKLGNIFDFIQPYLEKTLEPGDIVIDATVGNGCDTITLLNLIDPGGKLYGFDIQEKAINVTKRKINQMFPHANYQLIHDSHENLHKHINEKVDLIIFNLGFLPGGDKTITTQSTSTITAVNAGLSLLKNKGSMIIAIYPGHEEGFIEKQALFKSLASLEQKKYDVSSFQFVNQINDPPLVLIIQKKRF